jgi:hypothetical protein
MYPLAVVVESDAGRQRPVEADPELWRKPVLAPMLGECSLDLHGTLDGVLRAIETGEDAIADVIDLLPAVVRDEFAQRLVMPAKHLNPGLIPIAPTSSVDFTMSVNIKVRVAAPATG